MFAIEHIKHKQLSKAFLCFFVALSFFATLAPIASASKDAMPCCVGKAGHCDSGIAAKKVPPPPAEPMCGLDNAAAEDDGITIVAEPSSQTAETTSHAAESTSVSKPCRMECGACAAASSRQQKRERGIVEAGHQASNLTSTSHREDLPLVFTSNENWPRINPRGPPRHVIL
jgi:hypothetical protein